MKWLIRAGIAVAILAAGTVVTVERSGGAFAHDWRTASRESVGIAPDPAAYSDPVIQIYAARAWSWRGYFGVHTWISTKRAGAERYQVHEVIGWRAYRGMSVVTSSGRPPDGRWFGRTPDLLLDLRGPQYEIVIDKIEDAIARYPFADRYTVWPGPNSNTFTAFVAREVAELDVDLPPTAIGKDYLPTGIVAEAPSGSGYQVSLAGLLGVMVAAEEGLEINILGLTFGIDPLDLAVKLPGIGRIGPDDT
ncbi:MAG: DUF3750 domain-containing protein [Rhodospirillales bacterium]